MVSDLLLLEFRHSIRYQSRLFKNDRSKGFSEREGRRMLDDLRSDLAEGVLVVAPVNWPDVHLIAETLSVIHTADGGHRFADILHVATAVHLGCETFLTFDENQRALAEKEGMTVLPSVS